jgi:hypothetical protein
VAELWDVSNLKCTFTVTVDQNAMHNWQEVCQLAATIVYSEEEDELIWFLLPMAFIPLRVQFSLWLLSRNGIQTRDTVGCGKILMTLLVLFGCCVANLLWKTLTEICNRDFSAGYE